MNVNEAKHRRIYSYYKTRQLIECRDDSIAVEKRKEKRLGSKEIALLTCRVKFQRSRYVSPFNREIDRVKLSFTPCDFEN